MLRPQGILGPGNILGDTALTSVMATIGRGAGFAVPFFVAAWFGVTEGTDAFFYVYGIILLLAGIFAPVVQNVLVPFVAEIKAQDEREIGDFLGRALVFAVLALTAMAVLVLLLVKPVLGVVSDFSAESIDLIARLLLETVPLLVLLMVTSLLFIGPPETSWFGSRERTNPRLAGG